MSIDPLLAPFAPCIFFGQSHSYPQRTRIRRPAAERSHSLLRLIEGGAEIGAESERHGSPSLLLLRPGEAVILGQGCRCQVIYFDCVVQPRIREPYGALWVVDPSRIDSPIDAVLGRPLPRAIPVECRKRAENFFTWALDTWWRSPLEHLRANAELALLLLGLVPPETIAADQHLPDEAITRAEAYARRSIHRQLQVSDLAKAAGLSRGRFTTRYTTATGRTPADMLRRLRLETACRLLRDSDQSIDAIARAVGLRDQGALARLFRQCLGQTPSAYRKDNRASG